jgi:hypothetical protein
VHGLHEENRHLIIGIHPGGMRKKMFKDSSIVKHTDFITSDHHSHHNKTSSHSSTKNIPPIYLLPHEQFQQRRVIRRPKPRNGIPTLRNGKPVSSTARITTNSNIMENARVLVLHRPSSAPPSHHRITYQQVEFQLTRAGFTNPTVDFPALRRSSLILVKMAAKTGQDALVPPMRVGAPLLKMTTLSPTAETSG